MPGVQKESDRRGRRLHKAGADKTEGGGMTNEKLKEENKRLIAENKMLKTKYKSMYEYCKAVIQLTRIVAGLDGEQQRERE